MKRYILSVLILLTWLTPAKAMTAEELETYCKNVDVVTADRANSRLGPIEFMEAYSTPQRCIGFVDGFLSASAVAQFIIRTSMTFCQPQGGISIDQARRVYLKRIAEYPEDLHLDARLILTEALREAFPCDPP